MTGVVKGVGMAAAVAAGVLCALWIRGGAPPSPASGTNAATETAAGHVRGASGERSATRRLSPVRPVRLRSGSVVEEDPRSPDYDPVELMLTLDRSPSEIVVSEPVDAAWSTAFEERLAVIVSRDLATDVPSAELDSIECKTSSCEVTIAVDGADALMAYEFVQAFVPLGQAVQPRMAGERDDGRHELVFDALLSPETRDPDDFAEWYEADRSAREADLARFRRSQEEEPAE